MNAHAEFSRREFMQTACAVQAGLLYGGQIAATEMTSSSRIESLKYRLERCLYDWCHWLADYLWHVPGTDSLCTMNPTLGTGNNPYRDVAGNQFAAATAAYWLSMNDVSDDVRYSLEGLIRLALGTHLAVKQIDRPDIQKWGAGYSAADDWHACLFAATHAILQPQTEDDFSRERDSIFRWEADRISQYGISKQYRSRPGHWPEGSCGESNAWSACHLQFARLRLDDETRDSVWLQAAVDRSLNAICMESDWVDTTLIHGQPVNERVKGANFEPGGIQEHHGFFHPGYMAWPVAYLALAELADRNLPPNRRAGVFLRHWKTVFDRLKQATFSNGRFIHCAGDDWNVYGYGNSMLLPAALFAAFEWQDADAARLVDEWLKLIEYQQSLADGAVQAARLTTLQRISVNDFSWYEAIDGACLALAHWVLQQCAKNSDLPSPVSDVEYNRHQAGFYFEPNTRMVWSRTPNRWASAAWRSAGQEWQIVMQPVDRPHLLRFNHNGTGLLELNKALWRTTIDKKSLPNVVWYAIEPLADSGFWTLGCVEQYGKSTVRGVVGPLIEQYQALVVLPDGPCLWMDFVRTLDQVLLLRSASFGMQLAADIFNRNHARIRVGNRWREFKPHPHEDTWIDLETRNVGLEGDMTVRALWGEGTFHLLQKRRRDPQREKLIYENDPVGAAESLLAHGLFFGMQGYNRPQILGPGTMVRDVGLAIGVKQYLSNIQPAIIGDTPFLRAIKLTETDRWISINFTNESRSLQLPCHTIELKPHSIHIS